MGSLTIVRLSNVDRREALEMVFVRTGLSGFASGTSCDLYA